MFKNKPQFNIFWVLISVFRNLIVINIKHIHVQRLLYFSQTYFNSDFFNFYAVVWNTCHWEPKHKHCKTIKTRQTNNANHCRDILTKGMMYSHALISTYTLPHNTGILHGKVGANSCSNTPPNPAQLAFIASHYGLTTYVSMYKCVDIHGNSIHIDTDAFFRPYRPANATPKCGHVKTIWSFHSNETESIASTTVLCLQEYAYTRDLSQASEPWDQQLRQCYITDNTVIVLLSAIISRAKLIPVHHDQIRSERQTLGPLYWVSTLFQSHPFMYMG